MTKALDILNAVVGNVETVILGKTRQVKLILSAWLARGHILIEDVPGTGKTILARALAKSVNSEFKRIQFTPDLLPTDLIGNSIYDQRTQQFRFHEGPVFTSILLGDEINRATPRTQSALLEAMAESQVTVEGKTMPLDPMFFVVATQNPVEHQGTFPLPEAQLDRFMMKISLGYPDRADEISIVMNQNKTHPINKIEPVVDLEVLKQIRNLVPEIKVSPEVYQYSMDLVELTRNSPDIKLGASTRATIALIRASQAMSLIEGRDYVKPSDVFHLAKYVLGHRLVLSPEARIEGKTVDQVVSSILTQANVPMGNNR